jgi:peptidoglycan/xylan/chitin deacetylase (PgdA/CDA1 family)/glycosyltransferase involved in cell wall biosynthesis
MNILHVLSQVFPSGPEFYACALAKKHMDEGHHVTIVSDTLTASSQALYIPAPIARRKPIQRWRNIRFLHKLIRKNNIEVVHAHSRAASWVSYFAVKGTGASLISTIHGRQHLHTSTTVFDIYGDKVIAICENVKTHLLDEVTIAKEKIVTIPNGFDFEKLYTAPMAEIPHAGLVLSVIGRTNGPKGQITANLIKLVFPSLLNKFPGLTIRLIGGKMEDLGEEANKLIKSLNQQYHHRIEPIGFVNDLPAKIHESALVICSGRIAVESICLRAAVMAWGEGCYHGLVTEENLEEVIASNFGDILAHNIGMHTDYAKVSLAIAQALSQPVYTSDLHKKIESRFSIDTVAKEVESVYLSARMKKLAPGFIPVLMYHKIPVNPIESAHKIFVTATNFRKHLEFLKRKHFTPITFTEYFQFFSGQKPKETFPENPIILTFDDGYEDNYTNLLPLMNEFNYKGVIFFLGDEQKNYNFWDADAGEHKDMLMNLEQKKAFVKAGWEIGAHSMTHADLTQCDSATLAFEVLESRRRLQEQLNISVISFAYPTGHCNEKVKRFVRENGYRFGIATDTGGMHIEDDHYQIFRINMFPHDAETQLAKKTSWWYRRYYKFKRKK